ncbi:MAG: response regulator [Proteobacteria bacterium]|nr:response regulator [Pseudomonadota bacterium]MBU1709998.1 response regulator [Pseudomonadota bacterium]
MKKEMTVIITDDDEGHAALIQKNLKRAGINNTILHFKDGQEVLDFLFRKGNGPQREPDTPYLLLLDIRMPKIDGIEVLKQIKADKELRKIPVIMVTTTDDPQEVNLCHSLGCSNYITKPVDSNKFVEAIKQLGLFLLVVEIPHINGKNK